MSILFQIKCETRIAQIAVFFNLKYLTVIFCNSGPNLYIGSSNQNSECVSDSVKVIV